MNGWTQRAHSVALYLASAAILLLGPLALQSPAAAQGGQRASGREEPGAGRPERPSRADLEEAKARFVAGRAAVEAGRWADAVDNFQRAYELSRAPSALFNLAVALRALGRYREARDALRQLLERHAERLSPRLRADAQRYLEEASRQVAVVRLRGLAPEVRHLVRLDGRTVPDDGSRPLAIETDPGAHVLEVSRAGTEPFSWEGELRAGEQRDLAVRLEPREPEPRHANPLRSVPEAPYRDEEDEGGGLLSSPWFWVGTAVVLAAGGAATWWVLSREEGPSPTSPNVVDLDAW